MLNNDTNERNPIIHNHSKKSLQSLHVGMCWSTLWILTYLQWDRHQKSTRTKIGWGTTTTHVYNAWYPITALQKHLQFAASRWWKWWSWSKQAITMEFIDDTCCIYTTTTWFWLNLIFEGSSNIWWHLAQSLGQMMKRKVGWSSYLLQTRGVGDCHFIYLCIKCVYLLPTNVPFDTTLQFTWCILGETLNTP